MRFIRPLRKLLNATIFGIIMVLGYGQTVHTTAVNNIVPEAKVSFTFDDAYESAITKAAPVLAEYGFPAVSYVDTANVGKPGRMRWDQVKQLQEKYGWEIGAHSNTHPLMTKIPASRQEEEIIQSKRAFEEHGIAAAAFATPYGDYSNAVLATIAKHYESHRGFHDAGGNAWPYSEYLLRVRQVQAGVTVDQVKGYIDDAIAKQQWLILVFHDITAAPDPDPEEYEYAPADLDAIAAHVQQHALPVTTVSQGIIKSNVNLLPNPSFDNGVSDGWTTDSPDRVQADAGHNGSLPSPKHSIFLSGGNTSAHLYSPALEIDAARTYMLKSYLHLVSIITGEIGYYIDEYDARGKWISGQWKKAEKNAFVENINFTYKPSSSAVQRARLQIYVTPGSGAKAYVDNFQWFPLR